MLEASVVVSRRPKLAGVALLALLALAGSGCSSAPTENEADDYYRQGLAKSQGDTMGAIQVFEEGLTKHPDHTRMRFALARLQYDTGEVQHLEERQAYAGARHAQEEGHAGDVQKIEREAQDHHAKAQPFYRACRENLKLVVAKEEDPIRTAWAYELLMRCDVFFEDYKAAIDDLQHAIEFGKPTGEKLAEWQDFLTQLKNMEGPHKHTPFN